MPARNRYAFLLGQTGDVAKNVSNIYAQLQAPEQRKAVEESLNKSVKDSAPTTRKVRGVDVLVGREPVYSAPGKNSYGELVQTIDYYRDIYEPTYYDVVVPSANPVTYTDASARAARDAYAKTINPADLVKLPGRQFQTPGYIANAYINPSSESAYDLAPLFDSRGQQVAGAGTARKPASVTSRMFDELESGEMSKMTRYNKALIDNLANLTFAVDNAKATQLEAIKNYRPQYQESPFTVAVVDPNASYNRQVGSRDDRYQDYLAAQTTQGNRYGISFLPGGGTGPDSFYQINRQIARDAAINRYSNTPLSASFYGRGGHDNPTSFPAGYRL